MGIFISILFFGLYGAFEAVMDTLQFKFHTSVFKDLNQVFWNPEVSWQNKWKDGCPKFGPKFWGSTTWFVFVTDGWHLMKWCRNRALDTALIFVLASLTSYNIFLIISIVCLVSIIKSIIFEKLFKYMS